MGYFVTVDMVDVDYNMTLTSSIKLVKKLMSNGVEISRIGIGKTKIKFVGNNKSKLVYKLLPAHYYMSS